MWHWWIMPLGEPKYLTEVRRFFLEPGHPKQRMYEALRAYFVEGRPSCEVARAWIETLRKQNYSVYEISEILKEHGRPSSPTAVREVLKELGFAALPRRLEEERPAYPRPTVEPVADVRSFSLAPRRFQTRCGGCFCFCPSWCAWSCPHSPPAHGCPARR
jgi:hypothetical protein